MDKKFTVKDIEDLAQYEKLSRRAAEFLEHFLNRPAPRTVPQEWLNALCPTIFRKGVLMIKGGMIGLMLGISLLHLAKYNVIFLAAILLGTTLVFSRLVVKKRLRNILANCALYSGTLVDISSLGTKNGGFYMLKIAFQVKTAGEVTCRTMISEEIAHFFGIEKLKRGMPIDVLYFSEVPGRILLPIVIFYQIRSIPS